MGYAVQARSPEGTVICGIHRNCTDDRPMRVGVRGIWYDVTSVVDYHPGGNVILEYVGKDATFVFEAFHSASALKRAREVGTYHFAETQFQKDITRLHRALVRDGFFKPQYLWMYERCCILVLCVMGAVLSVLSYTGNGQYRYFVSGAASVAAFWQQTGFLMHDCMHTSFTGNRRTDHALGWVFAACFGVSRKWWKDEHFEHHIFTNAFEKDGVCVDPQTKQEYAWVTDPVFLPVLERNVGQKLSRCITAFQAYYWLPVVMVSNPFLRINTIVTEQRPKELLSIVLHYSCVTACIRQFNTILDGIAFFVLACLFMGVLSVQLMVSHTMMSYATKEHTKSQCWITRQLEATLDIEVLSCLDWLYGGLNLHTVHHIFPRLPRRHFRAVYPILWNIAKRHNVKIRKLCMTDAIKATIRHMRSVGRKVSKCTS